MALFGGIGSAGPKKIVMVWTSRIGVTGIRGDEKICLTGLPFSCLGKIYLESGSKL